MNNIKSKVMTAANRLVKGGMTRSLAMVKAWTLAKANGLQLKVKGTSHRQATLETLAKFRPEDVAVQLHREPHNSHDNNAVAVYAATPDKRVYFIGYLAKAAAFVLSSLMDKGKEPKAIGFSIVGGFNPWVSLGARIAVRV